MNELVPDDNNYNYNNPIIDVESNNENINNNNSRSTRKRNINLNYNSINSGKTPTKSPEMAKRSYKKPKRKEILNNNININSNTNTNTELLDTDSELLNNTMNTPNIKTTTFNTPSTQSTMFTTDFNSFNSITSNNNNWGINNYDNNTLLNNPQVQQLLLLQRQQILLNQNLYTDYNITSNNNNIKSSNYNRKNSKSNIIINNQNNHENANAANVYYSWTKAEEEMLVDSRHSEKLRSYFVSTNNKSKSAGWQLVREDLISTNQRAKELSIDKIKNKYKDLLNQHRKRMDAEKQTGNGPNKAWEHEQSFIEYYQNDPMISPESIVELGVNKPREILRDDNESNFNSSNSVLSEPVSGINNVNDTSDSEIEEIESKMSGINGSSSVKLKRQAAATIQKPSKTAAFTEMVKEIITSTKQEQLEIAKTANSVNDLVGLLSQYLKHELAIKPKIDHNDYNAN